MCVSTNRNLPADESFPPWRIHRMREDEGATKQGRKKRKEKERKGKKRVMSGSMTLEQS